MTEVSNPLKDVIKLNLPYDKTADKEFAPIDEKLCVNHIKATSDAYLAHWVLMKSERWMHVVLLLYFSLTQPTFSSFEITLTHAEWHGPGHCSRVTITQVLLRCVRCCVLSLAFIFVFAFTG